LNLGVNCDRKARQRLRPIYRIRRGWSAYSGRKFTPDPQSHCPASYAEMSFLSRLPRLAAASPACGISGTPG
jgi:hypothetical protein